MDKRFFENWATQLRKGLLELGILNAICAGRLYGYDIVRRLRLIEGLVISEGTIYPILSRLRRQGLVATAIEESAEGPPRKYYSLTPDGQDMLNAMNDYWQQTKSGTDTLRQQDQPSETQENTP